MRPTALQAHRRDATLQLVARAAWMPVFRPGTTEQRDPVVRRLAAQEARLEARVRPAAALVRRVARATAAPMTAAV